jgi:hypothetical protein
MTVNIRSKVNWNNNLMIALFLIKAGDKANLENIMAQLRKIDGIQDVQRKAT